ncbi:MAG: ABC transporter ATP-binding protein [Thermodesulfobacteriota bacterium]
MELLQVIGISKRFGGLVAVNNSSLTVRKGEIFGLIGPNGAGKTTLLNTVAGLYLPDDGRIVFAGQDITRKPAFHRCCLGIARTFQIVRCFPRLTALENVMVGAVFGQQMRDSHAAHRVARELLDFVELEVEPDAPARNLNTVQLKRVELARALATGCRLLLLDELAAGLTPGELGRMADLVRRIRAKGITIIMVEHLMRLIMGLCDRIAVLHFGEKIAEGAPDEIARDERVIEAYLGENYTL